MLDNKQLLKIQEVSVLIDTSIQTINSWYRWKRENPDNELTYLLPDVQRIGNRKTRLWKAEDINKLREFKERIPKGRYGIMGSTTQKYTKNSKWNLKKGN